MCRGRKDKSLDWSRIDLEFTNNGSGEIEDNGVKCVDKTLVNVVDQWKDNKEIVPGED